MHFIQATFLEPGPDGEIVSLADHRRLTRQLDVVRAFMVNSGQWHTLAEIERSTGFPQASISARLRDLRKEKFGGFNVERKRLKENGGTWAYRVVR